MNRDLLKQGLITALGKSQCLFDEEMIAQYLQSLTNVSRQILGVVKPLTIEQIQLILKIANEHTVSVYTISQGNNWGYGEKLPVEEDNLIIDLSSLKTITNFNEELGYISVQPGVTQLQLYDFLKKQRQKYMVPVTGAGIFGSILGNAIDRGYGITPYCDHFQAITEMKVLLADGQIIQTGLSRFGAKHSGPVFKWGIGPYQDGLYAQGNFGIVIEITLVLKKIPPDVQLTHVTFNNIEQLMQALPLLKELYEQGTISSGISIFNGLRALAVSSRFPYLLFDPKKGISEEIVDKLLSEKKLSPWMALFAVYGTPTFVKYQIKEIKHLLKPLVRKCNFFSKKSIQQLTLLNRFLKSKKLTQALHSVQTIFNIISGIPMKETLNQVFWRSRLPLNVNENTSAADITAYDNGLLWFSPILPFSAKHLSNIHTIIKPILTEYGFEFMFGCAGFSPHFLDVTIPIFFNKHDIDETKRALACYNKLFEQCLSAGYMPYRMGINQMRLLPDTPYDSLNTKLKTIIDKNRTLSPGRYVR